MPRLIDANALKTVLCASKCGVIDPATCECGCMDVLCIDNAPTIDAVEVVRCKECRFFVQDDEENEYCDPSIWAQSAFRTIYDFCSKGLKRDAAD